MSSLSLLPPLPKETLKAGEERKKLRAVEIEIEIETNDVYRRIFDGFVTDDDHDDEDDHDEDDEEDKTVVLDDSAYYYSYPDPKFAIKSISSTN